MEANGLRLIELASTVEYINAAWLHYAVRIGTWSGNAFHFHDAGALQLKYMQRVRIFDDQSELLVWRGRAGLQGRLRRDDANGTGVHAVEAGQVLFGTRNGEAPSDEYTEITEDRGTTLILPFRDVRVNDKRDRIAVKTRNYVEYNAMHQATYADCRFVGFRFGKEDLE
ncbi:MAG: CRISPR-associated protein [Desulfobacteraceae bacterium 4572_187]|nr:MAG: CRISPR-associated protein [Desulfobacteraceae bacterium 4572_187]